MRKSMLATALAGILVWAGVASAGPLSPTLFTNAAGDFVGPDAVMCGAFSCLAGEGAAPNGAIGNIVDGTFIGAGAVQHVDWIVVHDGNVNGGYAYYYQLENSSVFSANALNIGGLFSALGNGGTGFFPGLDLDVAAGNPAGAGHMGVADGGIFPNLGSSAGPHTPPIPVNETESTGMGVALAGIVDPATVELGSIFATWSASMGSGLVLVGQESSILVGQGIAPVYKSFAVLGSGSQGTAVGWSSGNGNPLGGEIGQNIAVPGVPEPASLLLLGSGLVGLGFWARRRES